MTEAIKRSTAYKVWINDLIKGQYNKGPGQFDVGYLKIGNKTISRANIIASIIDKFNGETYINAIIDDGTGNIKIKLWGEDVKLLDEVNIGDLVNVIAKVKESNGEIYLSAEIIKKIENPLWLKIRKLELIKIYGEPNNEKFEKEERTEPTKIVEEKMFDINYEKNKIISLISNLDVGNGADSEDVINSAGIKNSKEIIEELIRQGELFEIKKGKLKVM